MPTLDQRLAPTSAAQHSLFLLAQIHAAGGTNAELRSRCRSGRWINPARGLYGLAGVPWSWRRLLCAAVLSTPGALASHRAAASLLDVGGAGVPPLELTVPRGRLPRRRFAAPTGLEPPPTLVIHESVDTDHSGPQLVDGIPCTSPTRVAVDLGSVLDFDRYRLALGRIRRHHSIDWPQLYRCYRTHSIQGRNGCGALRDALDLHFGEEGAPDEMIELLCADLLTDAGLPAPVHQHEVRRHDGRMAILDLAYPDWKVGIETEGGIHADEEVKRRDRRRQNSVGLVGWRLLCFGWSDVRYDRARVASEVRAALRLAGAPV